MAVLNSVNILTIVIIFGGILPLIRYISFHESGVKGNKLVRQNF
jgi:hypothetical protein